MKKPVASEMPRCAPPHINGSGEEPCRGRGGRNESAREGFPPGAELRSFGCASREAGLSMISFGHFSLPLQPVKVGNPQLRL